MMLPEIEPHQFGKANNFSIGLRAGLENPNRAGVRRWRRQVFHFLKTKKGGLYV